MTNELGLGGRTGVERGKPEKGFGCGKTESDVLTCHSLSYSLYLRCTVTKAYERHELNANRLKTLEGCNVCLLCSGS